MKKFISINLLAICGVFACATTFPPVTYTDKNGNSISYSSDGGVIVKGAIGGGGLTVGTPVKPSGK